MVAILSFFSQYFSANRKCLALSTFIQIVLYFFCRPPVRSISSAQSHVSVCMSASFASFSRMVNSLLIILWSAVTFSCGFGSRVCVCECVLAVIRRALSSFLINIVCVITVDWCRMPTVAHTNFNNTT